MKIQELENQTVQINKTSITVKDKFLKTCGVVKNIQTVQTLSRGECENFWKITTAAGICGTEFVKSVVISNGKLYYLVNQGALSNFEEFIVKAHARGNYSTSEEKHYNKILKSIESAEKNGITVISCAWIFDIL